MISKSVSDSLQMCTCLIFIAVSTFLTPTYSREKEGGVNGGGGNEIEALFKARSIELVDHILSFDQENIALLKFDIYELFATLHETGGLFVLCATGKDLESIRSENKMARVFNERPGTIFLNCNDYGRDEWRKKLDWNENENAIFILHECLRVMDFAGENNYGFSKNYLKASLTENKRYYQVLVQIIEDRNEKCKFSLKLKERSGAIVNLKLKGNAHTYFSKRYSFHSDTNIIPQILGRTTEDGKLASRELIAKIKELGCER